MKKIIFLMALALMSLVACMFACSSSSGSSTSSPVDDDQSPAADDDNDDDNDDDQSPADDDDDASPECGTVTRGALEWAQCDNGSDINQPDAVAHTMAMNLGGHTDWRLPTRAELQPLYDPSQTATTACYLPVHIAKPFQLSCKWVWTSEVFQQEPDLAWLVSFESGEVTLYAKDTSDQKRALAVRDVTPSE